MTAPTAPIYLDYQATTPVDPRVVAAMLPFFTENYGNAASKTHAFGWRALEAVELARREVAKILGCASREIIFTSGATESNNLAIQGVVRYLQSSGKKTVHIVSSAIEHHAVLDPCLELAKRGVEVTLLNPDRHGRVSAADVREAITDDTALVSILAAHNEIGTLYPLAEIGRVCKERGVLFHTDAAQAVGKVPLDVSQMGIDLLSVSGHKLYGPKGVGALFVRCRDPRVRLEALVQGGGHERGLRSGTINVPGAVGLGKACSLAREELGRESRRLLDLRRWFLDDLQARVDGVSLNGHPEERLPGNLNLSFDRVEGESLVMSLKNIAVSTGSACTSQIPEASYVLRAIGVRKDLAHASLRIGFGRFTTDAEIEAALDELTAVVQHLRVVSSTVYGKRS